MDFDKNIQDIEQQNTEVLSHEEFYAELVASMSRFVTPIEQENIRNTHVLVAGCGSIGSPIVEMLAKQGCENITAADPDVVENSNLNRQSFQFWQIGKNKAQSSILNARLINPAPTEKNEWVDGKENVIKTANIDSNTGFKSIKEGITYENVQRLVSKSDIVVDAIDISALDMIYELHKEASIQKKPVIVGYDLAGTAMVAVYRYDIENIKPLMGELNESQIDIFHKARTVLDEKKITHEEFMDFIYDAFTGPIKPLDVPLEQLEEILSRKGDEKVPQLGTTSRVLSALSVEAIKRIRNGEKVKDRIVVDVPSEVRISNPTIFKKVPLMIRTLIKMNSRAKSVKETLGKI